MTNQQLKAHCEDVIANPQDHQDWVAGMARVALVSLEAEPVVVRCRYHPTPQCDGKWIYIPQAEYIKDETGKYQEQALYTAPPVPEMKPVIVAKDLKVKATSHQSHLDYAEGYNDRAEMDRNAIRAAGYEVKS